MLGFIETTTADGGALGAPVAVAVGVTALLAALPTFLTARTRWKLGCRPSR